MLLQNNIDINLHDFNVQGNCLADIWFPVSKQTMSNFKVKQGAGGGVQVYMPSGMGTTWLLDEIEWSEVRRLVTIEYHRALPALPIDVEFHDINDDGSCLADVTLRETGNKVSNLKVKVGLGNGIMVHMPQWMHTRWSYSEVQWSEVRQIVAKQYVSHRANKSAQVAKNTAFRSEDTNRCLFYSVDEKIETTVLINDITSEPLFTGIRLSHKKGNADFPFIYLPRAVQENPAFSNIGREKLIAIIRSKYLQYIGEGDCNCEGSDELQIRFGESRTIITCLADVKLPHKINAIKGFKIKQIGDSEKIIISTPTWMERWIDKKTSWFDLCAIITEEYNKRFVTYTPTDIASTIGARTTENSASSFQNPSTPSTSEKANQPTKAKNELGRIKNAESSSFIFYPRTVLRVVDSVETNPSDNKAGKYGLFDLVSAMNKGSLGGIGPFEISILEWIGRLRYVTSTMVLDLIKAGYVTYGWRSDVTQAKLSKIINRMANFNLINITRFVTLDDKGNVENSSIMRVYTLGLNGSILLHELEKTTSRYSPFDIFQDGNTVKRYLASNQWLIYWLKAWKEAIGENYETSNVIQLKGTTYLGARIYAMATINDYTMVAEPIRRVEDFEVDHAKQMLCEKVGRLITMFNNPDQLYRGKDEMSFALRPIIVFICEDDDHILNVWDAIKNVLPDDECQIVWFTTDLRIYNYDKMGERFFYVDNGELKVINTEVFLGLIHDVSSTSEFATSTE